MELVYHNSLVTNQDLQNGFLRTFFDETKDQVCSVLLWYTNDHEKGVSNYAMGWVFFSGENMCPYKEYM